MFYLQTVLLALVTGGLVYLGLIIASALHYLRSCPRPALGPTPPISVVKPLHGIDEGLEDNLISYFEQDYPHFELILGVDTADDKALPIVERVRARYPQIPCQILVTGRSPYINPKVYSLEQLTNAVQHDLVVMSDSDIRVTPEHLRVIGAEFADPKLGLVTCPYRAVPGDSFWSRLEAIGMNTEFIAGILVARRLEGMNFSVGPTIACRRQVFTDIGGFPRVKNSYIDDFLVGRYAHEAGWKVELSSYVIEHRIGTQSFKANCKHRVTWLRGTRYSRPAGYFGQVFTYPTPWALLLTLINTAWWPLLAASVLIRALAAHATGEWVLHDPLTRRLWYLVPLQDLWSWGFYWLAFSGRTMTWRGRRYMIQTGGDLTPIV